MKTLRVAVVLVWLIADVGPSITFAQPPQVPASVPRVLAALIGDFDCFGLGVPVPPVNPTSPCGTLSGPPVQETDDPPLTDTLLACPTPSLITLTHTFSLPAGASILGAVWAINLAGIEKTNFNTTILIDFIPVPVPDMGADGTGLIAIPLVPPLTSVLEDGELVVQIIRGGQGGCDDLAVDGSWLAIAYQVP